MLPCALTQCESLTACNVPASLALCVVQHTSKYVALRERVVLIGMSSKRYLDGALPVLGSVAHTLSELTKSYHECYAKTTSYLLCLGIPHHECTLYKTAE